MARWNVFGIPVKIDFRAPAFGRGEQVSYHGKYGKVTHFDGDIDEEGNEYDDAGDNTLWVEFEDGSGGEWVYTNQLQSSDRVWCDECNGMYLPHEH